MPCLPPFCENQPLIENREERKKGRRKNPDSEILRYARGRRRNTEYLDSKNNN